MAQNANWTPPMPTEVPRGKFPHWTGEAWVFRDLEEPGPEIETRHPTYAELRAREYPPFTDYLDGLVKGDQAQIDAYIAACLAVKAKYPKPTE